MSRLISRRTTSDFKKTANTKELWLAVCATKPEIRQRAYEDTIKSIGTFFSRYQPMFFAHQIPCDIDYPLCRPVSEKDFGICYIKNWLKQALLENIILRQFSPKVVIMLLKRYCPDYKELIVNLCEPVIINAAGCILTEKPPWELNITNEERLKIENTLFRQTDKENKQWLSNAARELCLKLNLSQPDATIGINEIVLNLYPRLKEALTADTVQNIFFHF